MAWGSRSISAPRATMLLRRSGCISRPADVRPSSSGLSARRLTLEKQPCTVDLPHFAELRFGLLIVQGPRPTHLPDHRVDDHHLPVGCAAYHAIHHDRMATEADPGMAEPPPR